MYLINNFEVYESKLTGLGEETHKRTELEISAGVGVSGKTSGHHISEDAGGAIGTTHQPRLTHTHLPGESFLTGAQDVYATDHKLINKTNLNKF